MIIGRQQAQRLVHFRRHQQAEQPRLECQDAAAAQRHQIERQVQETLSIEASQTAQLAGIKPEHTLPQEPQVAAQVDRLKAERDQIFGESAKTTRTTNYYAKDRMT